MFFFFYKSVNLGGREVCWKGGREGDIAVSHSLIILFEVVGIPPGPGGVWKHSQVVFLYKAVNNFCDKKK